MRPSTASSHSEGFRHEGAKLYPPVVDRARLLFGPSSNTQGPSASMGSKTFPKALHSNVSGSLFWCGLSQGRSGEPFTKAWHRLIFLASVSTLGPPVSEVCVTYFYLRTPRIGM